MLENCVLGKIFEEVLKCPERLQSTHNVNQQPVQWFGESPWQNVLVIDSWPATAGHINYCQDPLPTLELSHPTVETNRQVHFSDFLRQLPSTPMKRAISAAIVMPVGSVTDLQGVGLVAGWSDHSKPSGERKNNSRHLTWATITYNSLVLTCFDKILKVYHRSKELWIVWVHEEFMDLDPGKDPRRFSGLYKVSCARPPNT